MSAASYREAATRYRAALDLLGPYAGPCGLCGFPDRRHRQADSIVAEVVADPSGTGATVAAEEYLDSDLAETVAFMVTVALLAADPRRHGITRGRAAGIDREVWADG